MLDHLRFCATLRHNNRSKHMSVQECIESWFNGNLSTVIDYIVDLPSSAEAAYYATIVSKELCGREDWHTFHVLLAGRMIQDTYKKS